MNVAFRRAPGIATGASLLLALLAVWRIPTVVGRKLALFATENGHWIMVVPVVLGVGVGWCFDGARWCLLLMNTAAFALFLSPALRAAGRARSIDDAWVRSGLPVGSRDPRDAGLTLDALPASAHETRVFGRGDGFELRMDF